jgi:hypothetical protein
MRLVAITAIVFIIGGCRGSDAPTAPKTLPGTYTLRALGGFPLPGYTPGEPGFRFEIPSGVITLHPDGAFEDTYPWRELNDAGEETRSGVSSCSGTWTHSGNEVTLEMTRTSECDDSGTAVWDGANTLTIDWASFGGTLATHVR